MGTPAPSAVKLGRAISTVATKNRLGASGKAGGRIRRSLGGGGGGGAKIQGNVKKGDNPQILLLLLSGNGERLEIRKGYKMRKILDT